MTIRAKGVRVALANYVLFCELINDCRNRQDVIRAKLDSLGIKPINYGQVLKGSGATIEHKIIELVSNDNEIEKDIACYSHQIDIADKFMDWLSRSDRKVVVDFYIKETKTDEIANETGYSESAIKKQIYALIEEWVQTRNK